MSNATITRETGRLADEEGHEPEAFHSHLSTEVTGEEPNHSEFRTTIQAVSHRHQLQRGDLVRVVMLTNAGEEIAELTYQCVSAGMEDQRTADGTVSVRVHKLKGV